MISCPSCKHSNPEGLKFCENCGTALTRACPNCGQPVSASAKFCGNCGAALSAAPPEDPQVERLKRLVPKEFADRLMRSRGGQVERERRIVTILFSDVKGSTALGEERDPEEIMEIMNGAFDALIEPIYRYEGTLARLMGDAILAFFGAPVAHEDDAVRAVLAGLVLQDKIRAYAAVVARRDGVHDFAVRVGINTGLVVVGEVGSDLRVEYTAMGDAINVASRLENAAAPGTIVISENTARLARHAVQLESLGGLTLKGKAEPVPAYRVIGAKPTIESARGIEGLSSPMVGRQEELSQLVDAVEGLAVGRGQIVSIMGEAGLGKSRLLAELKKRYAGDSGEREVQWLEGRSFSFSTATPFAPFIDLLSKVFDLHAEESDPEKYAKIKAALARYLPDQSEGLAPFAATLLGVQLSDEDVDHVRYLMPPDLRERMFRAVLALIQAMASQQPTVLVLEDLHWADSSSLDLAGRLLDLTEHAMLMIIALFRPQRQDPSWKFHETAARDYAHRYLPIVLEPLPEGQARELVANLLEIEDLPETVRSLILKKAEGNPFFVEEVIRSLLDAKLVVRENSHWRATREIADLAVPDTLAAVISARLDRLDDEPKRVAQTASVIGREFQGDVLREIYPEPEAIDESLRDLQRRELIREKSRVPFSLYLFKHALTQETAYNSVLMSKRRELHRRVAECLERLDPDRVNDIAWHYVEAKEDQRALPFLLASGDRAARSYAMPEAVGYYTRAVEIVRAGGPAELARRAFEGLGNALSFTFDIPGAVKVYEEMLALGQARNEAPMQVSAMNKLAMTLGMRMGQFPEAEKQLLEAERLARQHQDKPGLSETFFIRCGMCTAVGDYDNVINYMDQAAQFGHELGIQDQILAAKDHLARSHMFMTRFDEGWKLTQEALALARQIPNRELEAALLDTSVVTYHVRNGDLDAAAEAARSGSELATRIGSPLWIVYGKWALAQIERVRGEYENAIEHFKQAVQVARPLAGMMAFVLVQPLASLGATYLEIGDAYAARAEELFAEAAELMKSPAGIAGGGTAWLDMGNARILQGQDAAAEELFQKGMLYPTMNGYINKGEFLLGAARVALHGGHADEAERLFEQARDFAQERAMQNLYPALALLEGEIHAARQAEPAASFRRAAELANRMQMRPLIAQAHASAARALSASGQTDEAAQELSAAEAAIHEIAGLISDPEMRQAFLTSAARRLLAGSRAGS